MSEQLKKAMGFDTPLLFKGFVEDQQIAVAVVNPNYVLNYVSKDMLRNIGFEQNTGLYPQWVVDELRQEVERLKDMVEPHPPSRGCECQRCQADFAEKDKTPPDGLIYQTVTIPDKDPRNAQSQDLSTVIAFAQQQQDQAHNYTKQLLIESGVLPEWNENNSQRALIMALHGTPEQKEQARQFFSYHICNGFLKP